MLYHFSMSVIVENVEYMAGFLNIPKEICEDSETLLGFLEDNGYLVLGFDEELTVTINQNHVRFTIFDKMMNSILSGELIKIS